MPKITQVLKARVLKHSKYLAPWLRKNFIAKMPQKSDETKETTASNVTVASKKAEESPAMPSVTNFVGLLHITEVNLQSSFHTKKVLVLCDFACSKSWVSEKMLRKMKVQGTLLKMTVLGINSHQTIDMQIVDLMLTLVHSGGSCSAFVVKPYVGNDLNFGTEVTDV